MNTMYAEFLSQETSKMKSSEIRDLLKLTEGKNVISLAGGLPDPATLPKEDIANITQDVLREYWKSALQYSPTAGVTEFRKVLADFSLLRGISGLSPDNLFVTTGSQEALYMISHLLLDPGDSVIVEAPTYLTAINAFKLRSPQFHGIPLESDGMNIEKLEDTLKKLKKENKKVKFIYTIPNAQNPGGVTMSFEKRKALIEIATQYDTLILEDDAYGHLIFEGENPPAVKSLDREGRVIYTSTMSKILAPGLRLGWVVAQEDFIREMELMKQDVDLHTSTFNQYIAMEAIKRGVIQNNLPKVKQIYRRKRDVMIESLNSNFPTSASWTKPIGGMFVFVTLDKKIDTMKMLDKSLASGVAYVPGSSFFHDGSGRNTMRLNYSFPSEEQISRGIEILGNVIKRF